MSESVQRLWLRWPTQRYVGALLLTATAGVMPWLESRAVFEVTRALERCDRPWVCGSLKNVDVEGIGLRFDDLKLRTPAAQITSTQALAYLDREGLNVILHAVTLEPSSPDRPSTLTQRPSRPTHAPFPPRQRTRTTPPTIKLGGLPVQIRVPDTTTVVSAETRLRVHDLTIDINRQGAIEAHFEADARRGSFWAASVGRVQARPTQSWDRWLVHGVTQIRNGAPLATQAIVQPREHEIHAQLASTDGGQLKIDGQLDRHALRLGLQNFSMHGLGSMPWTRWFPSSSISSETSRVSGVIDLEHHRDWHVSASSLSVDALTILDPRISRTPVELHDIELNMDGHAISARRFAGRLAVRYGPIHGMLEAHRSDDTFSVDARLSPVDCQTFLDALPIGISGVVAGMQVEGTHAARVQVDIEHLSTNPRGQVSLDAPFLDACEVIGEAPAISLDRLRGPYRHRFIDGRGRTQERTLAFGAPEFVSLSRVPQLADAFTTLEDARFWSHDGFDREQMENAFWHNLEQQRISRGASTITQQTARNLFLGIDRSIARKLQEAVLAHRLEATLSKRRILELYLNIIELGPGVHGIEDAAQFYFGKSASSLSLLQSIHLASLAPAPHAYAKRFADGRVDDAWMDGLHTQAQRMHRHGLIDRATYRRARQDSLELLDRTETGSSDSLDAGEQPHTK